MELHKNIEVLVATMHQEQGDYSLLEKMNIKSDAIICNQCERYSAEKINWYGHNIQWFSFAERGVGLNRNNALMRATNEIIVFADDDMVYEDNYVEIISRAYCELPDADVIVFNLIEDKPTRYIIPKVQKVGRLNYLRYGAARITAKNSVIKLNGIHFNRSFGGGTEHSAGEDNLFLTSCLQRRLKVYAYPAYIARLTEERPSTWNTGDFSKQLQDKGILYKLISRKWWKLLCLQDAMRHSRTYGMSRYKAYKLMVKYSK